jgi:hypothetical protein
LQLGRFPALADTQTNEREAAEWTSLPEERRLTAFAPFLEFRRCEFVSNRLPALRGRSKTMGAGG